MRDDPLTIAVDVLSKALLALFERMRADGPLVIPVKVVGRSLANLLELVISRAAVQSASSVVVAMNRMEQLEARIAALELKSQVEQAREVGGE